MERDFAWIKGLFADVIKNFEMRSSQISHLEWALNPLISVLIRERRRETSHRQRRSRHVITKVEIGCCDLKECWQPPEAGRGKGAFCPRAFRKSGILLAPRFRSQASRTVKK